MVQKMIIITAAKKNKEQLFDEIEVLSEIRSALKNDATAKKICSEKKVDPWFLEGVPIRFDKIKPSAKTINASIILNKKLLKKPFNIIMRYVIHELTHAVQHAYKMLNGATEKEGGDYLNRDSEIEAFQYQAEFDSKKRGKKKAEKYVKDLVEFHEVKKDEKSEKESELLDNIS